MSRHRSARALQGTVSFHALSLRRGFEQCLLTWQVVVRIADLRMLQTGWMRSMFLSRCRNIERHCFFSTTDLSNTSVSGFARIYTCTSRPILCHIVTTTTIHTTQPPSSGLQATHCASATMTCRLLSQDWEGSSNVLSADLQFDISG